MKLSAAYIGNIAGLACDMRERGKNGTQGNNIGRNDSGF